MVVALVALVVIGPEKLPKVARTAGAFFGRLQRFAMQVKEEVNRESRFAELQKLQEEVKTSLQQEVDAVTHSILPHESPVLHQRDDVALPADQQISKPARKRTASATKRTAKPHAPSDTATTSGDDALQVSADSQADLFALETATPSPRPQSPQPRAKRVTAIAPEAEPPQASPTRARKTKASKTEASKMSPSPVKPRKAVKSTATVQASTSNGADTAESPPE